MMENRPIGVFDSGIGGLTILDKLAERLPHENILYYADTAHCPYGEKDRETVRRLAERVVRELTGRDAKMIVIACNTASTIASASLRKTFGLPIVATEPAVKPAVEGTRSGTVGILATRSTIDSGQIDRLAARYGPGARVLKQAAPELVELVERGELDGGRTTAALRKYLLPMAEAGCDHIVLGCTHYPFLRETIARVLGDAGKSGIRILDTADPVARRAEWVLRENGLLNGNPEAGTVSFLSSAGAQDAERIGGIFRTVFRKL